MVSILSGCLITNPVEFDQEEQVPPVILDVARSDSPIGSILEVNQDQTARIEIPVRIRDENVFDDLVARHRVVTKMEPEPEFEEIPLPEQGAEIRDHVVRVETTVLQKGGCHQLELVVSGSFVGAFDPDTDPDLFDVVKEAGDISRATWTIWEVSTDPIDATDGTAAQALLSTCPTEKVDPAP